MKAKRALFLIAMAALLAAPTVLAGCEAPASSAVQQDAKPPASGDLMQSVTAQALSNNPLPENVQTDFVHATADFSLDLFRNSYDKTKNSLLSPMSAACALAMTSNGTGGNTHTQFLSLLADGKLNQEQLNGAYRQWLQELRKGQTGIVNLANSIWIRQDNGLAVKPEFLQANADFFGADAYQLDFSLESTRDRINQWVAERTDGKITEMVEKIDGDTLMYLINTLYFEMDWKTPFGKSGTHPMEFHTPDGKTVSADFMSSDEEDAFYIHGKDASGIKKPYADERYSFLALLPKEGTSLDDYISSLTAEEFLSLSRQKVTDDLPVDGDMDSWAINPSQEQSNSLRRSVNYFLPKFQYSYEKKLHDPLQAMGLTDAFGSSADFSNLAYDANARGVYIDQVLQKTFIEVDELGTKAGASTLVEIKEESAHFTNHRVVFDRPFLYAIVDNDSGLPLFLGTVTNPLLQGE